MRVDGGGHLPATIKPSNDFLFVSRSADSLPAGRVHRFGLIRRTENRESIKRRDRKDRARKAKEGKIIDGSLDEKDGKNTLLPIPQAGRRRTMVSEEDKREYLYKAGVNITHWIGKLMQEKQGGQCQILANIVRTVSIGEGTDDPIPPSVLAHLLKGERKRVNQMIQRGQEEKLKIITDQTREKKERGSYVSEEEAKCTLKFVANLGELCSSTDNRYRIPMSRREVYELYSSDGVKTILYSLLIQFPQNYRARVQKYSKMNEDQKEKVPEKGLTKALFCISQWEQKHFEGDCPPFEWKRSNDKFWEIINARKEQSKKKIMRTFFGFKLHPCPFCTEFEEDIAIYEDLLKSLADEKEEAIRVEKNKRLEQWAQKIQALRLHKDKHETQRQAIQKWKKVCKYYPGVCLVYEDFCNLYEANSAKMYNLVMVLVYWDTKTNKMVEKYYDNFCRGSLTIDEMGDLKLRGSQDNHVYRKCWLEAFKAEIFLEFHTIIKTGDNGSALKSYDTFYLHSVLMRKHYIRIIYFTLCPYHAENPCDPAGAKTKSALKQVERKLGQQTGDAFETADARNKSRRPGGKVQEAKGFEAHKEFDDYMPEEMIRKKQDHWPYHLMQCCVCFFQLTDIHENVKDPLRTIELGACGMCAPTVKEPFGVIDLRWDTLKKEKLCIPCSQRFQRNVLLTEHNQSGYYLCPKTNVYRRETPKSLKRECAHCNEKVSKAHTESPHKSNTCPSVPKAKGGVLHRHETFNVISIDGQQRYPITTKEKKWTPADFPPNVLAELKSRYTKVKSTVQRHLNPKSGSVDQAKMMAPGITVVYRIDSAGRTEEKSTLPWGIGVCLKVMDETKTFRIQVFTPSVNDPHRAPWCTWYSTETLKELSFNDKSWMKVSKLTKDLIPTKSLHKIWKDKRFAWQWIALLEPTNLPAPGKLEFRPSLDDKEEVVNARK